MMMRRVLPLWMISLTLARRFSLETLCSSVWTESLVVAVGIDSSLSN
jgi:hypothetical protein